MAFRGGRGRGRGRGAARPGPLIRDEDGSLITSFKLDEPPPLFPKVETLPERPDITQAETVFHLERRRMLQTFWNQSAYYLEEKNEKTCANGDLHGEGSSSSSTMKRKPLSLYLLLTPDFFPTELLGNAARKRKATHQGGMWTLQNSDLGRLEKLAKLEAKVGEKGEGDEEKKEEDDEDNIDQAFDEEEEEVDDYNMMQEIDDDEEYDYEEAGEDEGPTY